MPGLKLFVFELFALIILLIQFCFGFFIPPEAQVLVLSVASGIFRTMVGRELFSGKIKPVVTTAYDFTAKVFWKSKLFWGAVVATIGALLQWKFGWVLDPKLYSVIVSAILTLIAKVTRQPVKATK